MPADRLPAYRPLRRFTLGSGPLKRTTDRLHVLSRLVLLLVTLAVVPLTVLVGTTVDDHLRATARHEAATRVQTPATLLADSPRPAAATEADGVATPATWRGPDGLPRTGRVAAPAGSHAGRVVPVWIDRSGAPTTAPLGDGDVAADTAAAVVLGPLTLLAVAAGAHLLVVGLLDRRRARRWATDWAAVEPLWRVDRA